MNIVHIITGLGGGGAEHLVLELAKCHVMKNDQIVVISVTSEDRIIYKFKENTIKVKQLNISSFRSLIPGIVKFLKFIKDIENPVFHCHMFHALMIAIIIKMIRPKIPIIFTLHTNLVKQFYRRIALYMTKPFRKYDVIFSNTSSKWYLKNNAVVPNGVDLSKFKELYETRNIKVSYPPFRFLFLARLHEPKNPLYLVELAKKLISNNVFDFKIIVVGEGHLKEKLIREIAKYNLEKFIELNDFTDNINTYLQDADCLILPSLWEGLPLSIIESAASGLPVITTPVGSIPDYLNSQNSWIIPLESFPEAMKDCMKNYSMAKVKAENLHKVVQKNFNINETYRSYLNLYLDNA